MFINIQRNKIDYKGGDQILCHMKGNTEKVIKTSEKLKGNFSLQKALPDPPFKTTYNFDG